MLWQDIESIRATAPLVHNITNYVVMNSTANALLAVGASPVMAHAAEEAAEMVGHASALVLNIGTLSPPWVDAMLIAGVKGMVAGGFNTALAFALGASIPATGNVMMAMTVGLFGYGISLVSFVLALRGLGKPARYAQRSGHQHLSRRTGHVAVRRTRTQCAGAGIIGLPYCATDQTAS